MRGILNSFRIISACLIALVLLSACTGWTADKDNSLAWMSLLLGNSQIARFVVKNGVSIVEDKDAREIVEAGVDSADNTQLLVSSSWSVGAELGSPLLLLPGTDNRFPLGLAGRVVEITDNGDGTKSLRLEKVTYAEMFQESTFDLKDIVLDQSNFVGVIAPSGVQAATQSLMVTTQTSAGNEFSFRNGAVVVRSADSAFSVQGLPKTNTTINAGTVSLNIRVDLGDMGDGIEASTMTPVDAV